MKRTDFEIMAPVGSRESLAAALQAGADAVYFGIGNLNMRSRSSANFTTGDMAEIAAICAARGVKTYLTVNTVIYDSDIPAMQDTISKAAQAGISAVIVSDIAAILYARSIGIPVHISTQVNVANTEALRFYARFADVIVLARELDMNKVAAISQAISREKICGPSGNPVRIEMFCHGALCMAVSGKCYMSLHQMNTSANRGACNQICRRAYTLRDADTGDEITVDNKYLMSPKDLKTIHFLNKMIDAGVTVFKIEGRARGPEYVAETVACYSEAIDAICNGSYTPGKIQAWDTRLQKVFNRGFWDGYYLGQRLGEWSHSYGSSATHVKIYSSKALRFFPKISVAEFLLESEPITVGDQAILIGPETGAVPFTVTELRVDLLPVSSVAKGQRFSTPVPVRTHRADRLYIWRTKNTGNQQINTL